LSIGNGIRLPPAVSVALATSTVASRPGFASSHRVTLFVHDHRHETVLQRVAAKDVGDLGAHDHANTEVEQGPRRVARATTAAEVVTADEDRGAAVLRAVQHELRLVGAVGGVAPIEEQLLAEAYLRRGCENRAGMI